MEAHSARTPELKGRGLGDAIRWILNRYLLSNAGIEHDQGLVLPVPVTGTPIFKARVYTRRVLNLKRQHLEVQLKVDAHTPDESGLLCTFRLSPQYLKTRLIPDLHNGPEEFPSTISDILKRILEAEILPHHQKDLVDLKKPPPVISVSSRLAVDPRSLPTHPEPELRTEDQRFWQQTLAKARELAAATDRQEKITRLLQTCRGLLPRVLEADETNSAKIKAAFDACQAHANRLGPSPEAQADDREVKALAALLYLASPCDLIPDEMPKNSGFLDDAEVLLAQFPDS